jgi:hypothetical protein
MVPKVKGRLVDTQAAGDKQHVHSTILTPRRQIKHDLLSANRAGMRYE